VEKSGEEKLKIRLSDHLRGERSHAGRVVPSTPRDGLPALADPIGYALSFVPDFNAVPQTRPACH
jgi:hypothetical protein